MGAGTELAKAYVQIVPSAKGIKGSISNVLGGEASSAGNQAGATIGNSLASTMKKVIAAAGIGQAIKSALTEGADLQQSLGGVETLFKDSADKVIANAENAYKTAGMSANEYMETVTSFSASLLQGLAGDTNKAADVADMALTDMSDNANKMGTSMELIQNAYQGFAKQNYTMLDNLKLGYGGTKTEMERLLADASKLSGVKYDISNLSDVYNAIHVIQEEMGITGTTAKEAAETFSGSLASMKAAGKNVLAKLTLGQDIKPALVALVDTTFTFMNKNLAPMLGNILSGIPSMLETAMGAVIRELNVLASNSGEIVESGTSLVKQLVSGMLSNVPYFIEGAMNLISSFGMALLETDWLALATDFVTELQESMLVASGEIFGSDSNILEAFMDSITNSLPDVLSKGSEIVTNLVNGVLSNVPVAVSAMGELMTNLLTFILDNMPTILQSGLDLITNLASGIVQNIPAILVSIAEVIANLLAAVGERLPEILESGFTLLGEFAAGIITGIPELLGKLSEVFESIKETFSEFDWLEIGKNIIEGIANGIWNFGSLIIDAAKGAALSALSSAKEALGIHSPSKVFQDEVGKMIPYGEAEGILQNADVVRNAIKKLSHETIGIAKTDVSYGMNAGKINSTEELASLASMAGKLDAMEQALFMIVSILHDGFEMQWDDRNLGRLVKKYA